VKLLNVTAHSFKAAWASAWAQGAINQGRLTLQRGVVWLSWLALAGLPTAAPAAGVTTSYQFAVSESGAATVTVPIQIPRGIGGMEPQLSFNYSSSAGNGLFGLGWWLGGVSSVTRCPKNLVTDGVRGKVGLAVGDRYCLDGQRLEIEPASGNTDSNYGTAGTSYRTAKETFSRVTAVGGSYGTQSTVPNGFRVETKAGLILDFGLTANSQVITNRGAGLGANTISRWMLQRISDRTTAGSFVEFVYCAGEVSADGAACDVTKWAGSVALQYVRYTNRNAAVNGEFAVVLGYESRPDRVQAFNHGSGTRQTQRVSRVSAYRDFQGAGTPQGTLQLGTLVRTYAIAYEPIEVAGLSVRATNVSRLKTITESDGAGNSLPPLDFSMAPDSVFGMSVQHRSQFPRGTPRTPDPCGGVMANKLGLQCP